MAHMEPYSKEWYDYLAQGKLMGVRCTECGAVEFPPVPICNTCGSPEVEWVEMSGRAKVVSFSYSYMGVPPFVQDPVMNVHVIMEEGPEFASWIPNMGPEGQDELLDALPLDVTTEIIKLDDGVWWPVFHLADSVDEQIER